MFIKNNNWYFINLPDEILVDSLPPWGTKALVSLVSCSGPLQHVAKNWGNREPPTRMFADNCPTNWTMVIPYMIDQYSKNTDFHLQSSKNVSQISAALWCAWALLKTTQWQSANFEVVGIPFSGKSSDASSLLERHSHPLRQTLINFCVQFWVFQLNLWHTALPEHRLYKCPPLTDKGCIKARLAAYHCLSCSSYWTSALWAQKATQWARIKHLSFQTGGQGPAGSPLVVSSGS